MLSSSSSSILDQEEVEYNKEVVAHFVADTYPDFRRTLNDLQRYSVNSGIDTGVMTLSKDLSIKSLVRKFYEQASEYYNEPNSAKTILILADYQHKACDANRGND